MAIEPLTKDDVTAFAPKLADVSSEAWLDILAYVNELDLSFLGETDEVTRMARIFLAAHIGQVTRDASRGSGGSTAGPLTSESAGGVRRSYGMLATGSGSLGSTRYGQMYMDILGMSQAAGPHLGGGGCWS